MSSSRTPYDEVPKEVLRQAERINEQNARLENLLLNLGDWLTECEKLLEPYSPSLASNIKILNSAVSSYGSKSKTIYNNLASKMRNYATSTQQNVEELEASIKSISSAIENL